MGIPGTVDNPIPISLNDVINGISFEPTEALPYGNVYYKMPTVIGCYYDITCVCLSGLPYLGYYSPLYVDGNDYNEFIEATLTGYFEADSEYITIKVGNHVSGAAPVTFSLKVTLTKVILLNKDIVAQTFKPTYRRSYGNRFYIIKTVIGQTYDISCILAPGSVDGYLGWWSWINDTFGTVNDSRWGPSPLTGTFIADSEYITIQVGTNEYMADPNTFTLLVTGNTILSKDCTELKLPMRVKQMTTI